MRFIGLLVIFSFLLAGCGGKPPMPSLSVNDQKIDYEPGSYFSKSLVKTVHSDAAAPPFLVKDKEPQTVAPEATLSIKFSKKPKKIVISEWKDDKEINPTEIKNKTFQLPKEKGTYIYSIRSEWSNRSGTYAFVVKVE